MFSMLIREVLFSQDKTWMKQIALIKKVIGSSKAYNLNQQGHGEQALQA